MNPLDEIKKYESMGFDYWLNELLSNVDDDMDTREGSVIYDMLAPTAAENEQLCLTIAETLKQSYTQTATGQWLDWRAAEKGITRESATNAQATAEFTNSEGKPLTNVNVGDRFSNVGDDIYFYTVVRSNGDGTALLQAEATGTKANGYTGQVLPVTPNDALSWGEITEVSVPAREDEDDEHLRERVTATDNYIAYGGNVADYQSIIKKIKSVGAMQIYPAWQGGSTVKLVVLDNDLKPASAELVEQVKDTIDPAEFSGLGYGLAPIGHKVTVLAPTLNNISVETAITTDGTVSASDLKDKVSALIEAYFSRLRNRWADYSVTDKHQYELTVYRSQILSAVLSVDHVTDAQLPTLNGKQADIELKFNKDISELPVLKEVILNE